MNKIYSTCPGCKAKNSMTEEFEGAPDYTCVNCRKSWPKRGYYDGFIFNPSHLTPEENQAKIEAWNKIIEDMWKNAETY